MTKEKLSACADWLSAEESPLFQTELRAQLKRGASYPRAREAALRSFSDTAARDSASFPCPENTPCSPSLRGSVSSEYGRSENETDSEAAILTSASANDSGAFSLPNNILALEYCRALRGSKSRIVPLPIARIGDGYSASVPSDARFTSATALRRLLRETHTADAVSAYCPEVLLPLYESLLAAPSGLIGAESMNAVLSARLLDALYRDTPLSGIYDLSEDLANRLRAQAEMPLSWNERVLRLKPRQYTYTRVSRALLHLCLGITQEEAEAKKAAGYADCLRILGFRKAASPLLSALKKNASLPLVANAAANRELLRDSIYRDNLYYALSANGKERVKNEYERELIIL